MEKNLLFEVFDELRAEEKWRNKARLKGITIDKKITKNGHLMLTIKKRKYDQTVIVIKQKEKLFNKANNLKIGDQVYIVGERKLDVVFCDVLKILDGKEQTELV